MVMIKTKKKVTTAKKATAATAKKKTASSKTGKKKPISKKKTVTKKQSSTKKKNIAANKQPAKGKGQKKSTSGNKVEKTKISQSSIGKVNKTETNKHKKKYRRRKIAHVWPDIGIVIVGRLKGQTFRAEIINDPDLNHDHGKGVKSLDDPTLITFTFNQAAQLFTREVREKNGMGDIANGWKW